MAKNSGPNPRSFPENDTWLPPRRARKHVFTPAFRLHTVVAGSGLLTFDNSLLTFHLLTDIYPMVPFPPSHRVVPQVTKTQSSGEGCKILFSESIRERAVFNGVRGSRRHRASGALDLVKLSSPLLHGVGPSARSACAAARSQRYRRRAQPVDSTPAQACSIRRSQPDSNAVAGPDGARSMSCASALPRKRRIRLGQCENSSGTVQYGTA